jgi:hypothetical protein
MRIRASDGLLALATCITSPAFAADVVDQAAAENRGTYVSATMYLPLGQEFVPTLSRIDWVEMWGTPLRIVPNGTERLSVEIHAGQVTESPLATSAMIDSPVMYGWPRLLRFEFQPGVALVPGETYVLVVRDSGELYWAMQCELDPGEELYSSGHGVMSGIANPALDLWFREGIVESQVPSHIDSWGAVKAAYRN